MFCMFVDLFVLKCVVFLGTLECFTFFWKVVVFGPNAMVNVGTECMGSVLAPGWGPGGLECWWIPEE